MKSEDAAKTSHDTWPIKVMTVREVSAYLHVHPSAIYKLLKQHQIPAFSMGSDWRFNIEAIDHWRLEQRKPGNSLDTSHPIIAGNGAQVDDTRLMLGACARAIPIPRARARATSSAALQARQFDGVARSLPTAAQFGFGVRGGRAAALRFVASIAIKPGYRHALETTNESPRIKF